MSGSQSGQGGGQRGGQEGQRSGGSTQRSGGAGQGSTGGAGGQKGDKSGAGANPEKRPLKIGDKDGAQKAEPADGDQEVEDEE
ncbi:MAG TPA: hypothetical protein VM509_11370 [Planctomycetota bacterium]|nr:hypothetical protein [Planctomycetota bacterium]